MHGLIVPWMQKILFKINKLASYSTTGTNEFESKHELMGFEMEEVHVPLHAHGARSPCRVRRRLLAASKRLHKKGERRGTKRAAPSHQTARSVVPLAAKAAQIILEGAGIKLRDGPGDGAPSQLAPLLRRQSVISSAVRAAIPSVGVGQRTAATTQTNTRRARLIPNVLDRAVNP